MFAGFSLLKHPSPSWEKVGQAADDARTKCEMYMWGMRCTPMPEPGGGYKSLDEVKRIVS